MLQQVKIAKRVRTLEYVLILILCAAVAALFSIGHRDFLQNGMSAMTEKEQLEVSLYFSPDYVRDTCAWILMSILAVCGLVLGVLSFYLHRMRMGEKRFTDISVFLLLCSLRFAVGSYGIQLFAKSIPLVEDLPDLVLMIMAIPVVHFVKNTGKMNKYPVITGLLIMFYGNAIIQTILGCMGYCTYRQMIAVTHGMLLGSILVLTLLLFLEYRQSRVPDTLRILIAMIALGIGGLLSLIAYWATDIVWHELFLELGILAFVVLLVRVVIIGVVRNLRFKTEAEIYRRMATEDKLTGMKNRRAFDSLVSDIASGKRQADDATLMFMDLNGLKQINDRLGHHTGDEAIVASAATIEKSFGDVGECFRLSGDEFCVILMESALTDEELYQRLQRNIDEYNLTCSRYQLEIAAGISHLKDEQGKIKRISDWKDEADRKMYTHKLMLKTNTPSEEKAHRHAAPKEVR